MRTEQLILENLIFNNEYASLVGVFLKPEYFKAHPEKIIFQRYRIIFKNIISLQQFHHLKI